MLILILLLSHFIVAVTASGFKFTFLDKCLLVYRIPLTGPVSWAILLHIDFKLLCLLFIDPSYHIYNVRVLVGSVSFSCCIGPYGSLSTSKKLWLRTWVCWAWTFQRFLWSFNPQSSTLVCFNWVYGYVKFHFTLKVFVAKHKSLKIMELNDIFGFLTFKTYDSFQHSNCTYKLYCQCLQLRIHVVNAGFHCILVIYEWLLIKRLDAFFLSKRNTCLLEKTNIIRTIKYKGKQFHTSLNRFVLYSFIPILRHNVSSYIDGFISLLFCILIQKTPHLHFKRVYIFF